MKLRSVAFQAKMINILYADRGRAICIDAI